MELSLVKYLIMPDIIRVTLSIFIQEGNARLPGVFSFNFVAFL